ncbi:hypothetical protein Taro_005783 [Colocasia esculenta]|uniref:Uncharacterized protein n=1 Tax=Colocasia esculenta TaxID=4460 RepID=A0A843TVB0_COLES|nr:hypothetical protein [Colocasia esculenta]
MIHHFIYNVQDLHSQISTKVQESTGAWGIPQGKLVQLRKETTLQEALAQHRCDAAPNWKTVTKPPPHLRLWGVGSK